jgi:oligopeptide/dipeptide ABC transporter ATP-binding protein
MPMHQLEAPSPASPPEPGTTATATATNRTPRPLIKVENLEVEFPTDMGTVHAVNGVDFQIMPGQTLGVVGESGCGKSVTARAILRILRDPGRITNGTITYSRPRSTAQSTLAADTGADAAPSDTIDLTALDPRGKTIRSIRGNDIAMIFQEPMTSLSPVHTIGNQICEAVLLHRDVTKKDAVAIAEEMLTRVGVPNARQRLDDYPHQFSGGMRQRAMIAMALSCQPSLLIADEPTTALDVTTEAQILELIREIQQDTGMAVMLITHNLGVVAEMAEEVIVMYLGKVVERTDVVSLFYDPQHPYTQALLSSIPRIGRRVEDLEVITGSVPDPTNIPRGCPFHTRCNEFMAGTCDVEVPQLREISPGHWVSCLRR